MSNLEILDLEGILPFGWRLERPSDVGGKFWLHANGKRRDLGPKMERARMVISQEIDEMLRSLRAGATAEEVAQRVTAEMEDRGWL